MFQVFFFHEILQKPFQFAFLHKITKMKMKSFECPKSIRNYKKKILGMSDTWSTSHLSHRSSIPAYYIANCWILELRFKTVERYFYCCHMKWPKFWKKCAILWKSENCPNNSHPVSNSFSRCVTCKIILIPKMKTCSNYYANTTLQGLLTLCVWSQIFPAK